MSLQFEDYIKANLVATDTSGGLTLKTSLATGDIEIGAVELKNATTDDRANILAANTARTTGTIVIATQPIDAAGNVFGRTAANTARTTGTLVAPVQVVDAAGNVLTVQTGAQVIASSTVTDSTASPVAAGTTDISFTTNSTFAGTINGVTRKASTTYIFAAVPGKTLPAITYTVTAGAMDIDKIT